MSLEKKVLAKYGSYKNSQQIKIWVILPPGFLKDFEHNMLCLWQLQITWKIFLLVPLDSVSEGCQHSPEAKEETTSATEKQRLTFEGRWIFQPEEWLQKAPLSPSGPRNGARCGSVETHKEQEAAITHSMLVLGP